MADAVYIEVPADQGQKRYQVKRGQIAINGAATTALVAAVTGKTIRLLSLHLTTSTAQTFYFSDGTDDLFGTNSIEGRISHNGAAGGHQLNMQFTKYGHLETGADGRALNLVTKAAGEVAGYFNYCEV